MAGPVDPDSVLGADNSDSGSTLDEAEVEHLKDLNVQKEELQALAEFKRQLEFIKNNEITYLVLGDFSEHPKRRLNCISLYLSGKSKTSAQLLIKLPYFDELENVSTEAAESNLETYLKFQSVARNVTAIVFVAEGRNAGSAVELGDLTPDRGHHNKHPYFSKTYLAVRDYSELTAADISSSHPSFDDIFSTNSNGETTLTTSRPYSSPQESKFEIFKREGRYWRWDTRPALWESADEIHELVTTNK
ncbi:hypothetical protein [Haloplanus sp. C73]|uniref:hypothetical protein n=1 Tax=Haloplanus sp. C73 TaxID=3421641 RepID=UPI003EBDF126